MIILEWRYFCRRYLFDAYDDNNDLNGSVDLLEVDEEELIRFEYISVPQTDRSIGDLLMKFLFL